MKQMGLATAAVLMAATALVMPAPASAHVSFGVSIDAGDVMFAYRDGYWDRAHRWHPWADPDDWRWYREHYRDHYSDWAHDRDRDMGWRDGGPGFGMGGPGMGGPGFSFTVGDVAFGYHDGYWDRWHRWHYWRNEYERMWWRDHYHDRYADWRHDRDRDMGWHHDWDHDHDWH